MRPWTFPLLFTALLALTLPVSGKTTKKTAPKKAAPAAQTQAAKAPVATATPTEPPSQPLPEPTQPGVVTEAPVFHVDGTVMVQHADKSAATALQTGSTVEKGDEIRVYDGARVTFKTKWGDKIGMANEAQVGIDEYYFEGPDRQIRLILRKGRLYLQSGDASSRQSFFEVQAGNQVVSLGDVEAQLDYDPLKDRLTVQYFHGRMKVIDREKEKKLTAENTVNIWENGKMASEGTEPMDEMAYVNFSRFVHEEDPIVDAAKDLVNNSILDMSSGGVATNGASTSSSLESQGLGDAAVDHLGAVEIKKARESFRSGQEAYAQKDYRAAKYYWEQALKDYPGYQSAQNGLDALKKDHPEIK